jgi:drug/metabolite transporter, DME family
MPSSRPAGFTSTPNVRASFSSRFSARVSARFAARDLTWLVAVGAGLWGTDAWFRKGLAGETSAPTLVFAEHLMLVVLTLPFLPRALRTFRGIPGTAKLAVVVIGVGASAIATALFTLGFQRAAVHNDFVTPILVQQLQPVFAIGGAVLLLRERLRPRFALFVLPALAGVWLVAFRNPFHVGIDNVVVVAFSLGAAALWALGTVLGRFVAPSVPPVELTTLRFLFGLPAAAVIVAMNGAAFWVPDLSSSFAVLGLVLVPSLLALFLYYQGLRRTAASRATLAELAYPLIGALVGLTIGKSLTVSQLVGLVVLAASVTLLSWHEARARTQAVVARPGPTRERTPVG